MFDGVIRMLTNVRHIPSMKRNLVSLGMMDSKGYWWTVIDGELKVLSGKKVILTGTKHRNLYVLQGKTIYGEANVTTSQVDANVWHMRLGHMSEKGLVKLHKRNLLPKLRSCKYDFCEHCVLGKNHRKPFGVGTHSSKGKLDYIHSDVWGGPSTVPSHSGAQYYVLFVDDYSRYVWIYFMQNKSEVLSIFKQWKALVETQTGRKVKVIRNDNGGEYVSEEYKVYCADEGIKRHFTEFYTPQGNGVPERLNRYVMERSRCMMSHSGLSKEFWAEAANTATYLINLSPHSAIDYRTPFEMWHGRPADYSILRVFGCDAYALVPKKTRTKLDPTSKKCIFLGYSKEVKGYRVWDPVDQKLIVSREITFNESRLSKVGENAQAPNTDKAPDKGKSPMPDVVEGEIDHSTFYDVERGEAPAEMEPFPPVAEQGEQVPVVREMGEQIEAVAGVPQEPVVQDQPESSLRRSTRISQAPERFGKWASSTLLEDGDIQPYDDGRALFLEEGNHLLSRRLKLHRRSLSGMKQCKGKCSHFMTTRRGSWLSLLRTNEW